MMTVGVGYQMARHQREDLLGCLGGDPGTGRAPLSSWATPEETRRAGSVVCRVTLEVGHRAMSFPCGQGRHMWLLCSTLVVWLRPSRESRHQHHPAVQRSAAEPITQDWAHWR